MRKTAVWLTLCLAALLLWQAAEAGPMSEPVTGFGNGNVASIVAATGYPRYVYRSMPTPEHAYNVLQEWRDDGGGLAYVGEVDPDWYDGSTCSGWQTADGRRWLAIYGNRRLAGSLSRYTRVIQIRDGQAAEHAGAVAIWSAPAPIAVLLTPSDSVMVAFHYVDAAEITPGLTDMHLCVQLIDPEAYQLGYAERAAEIDTGFEGMPYGGWLTSDGRVGLCYLGLVGANDNKLYIITGTQDGSSWGQQVQVSADAWSAKTAVLSPSDSVMVAYAGAVVDPEVDGGIRQITVRIMDYGASGYAARGAEIDTGVIGREVEYLWQQPDGRMLLGYIDSDHVRQTIQSDLSGANWTP